MLSVSSLACFDLVTISRVFNFLWSDPCQCAQNVQAEQTPPRCIELLYISHTEDPLETHF